MADLTATDKKFLTDLVNELEGGIFTEDFVLKDGVKLSDMIEEPKITLPGVPKEKIDRLLYLALSNAYISLKDTTVTDKILTTILNEDEREIAKHGVSKISNKLKDVGENPSNYFQPKFDYEKLPATAKEKYDAALKDIGVKKDAFEADFPLTLKFNDEVMKNPGKYFKRVPVNKIEEAIDNNPKIAELLGNYKQHIIEEYDDDAPAIVPVVVPDGIIDPEREAKTAAKYAALDKKELGWFARKYRGFLLRTGKELKRIDERRTKKGKISLSGVLEADYGPRIKESGLGYVLTSDKSWDELREELGDSRLADYAKAMTMQSIKHPRILAGMLTGYGLYSIGEDAAVFTLGFATATTLFVGAICGKQYLDQRKLESQKGPLMPWAQMDHNYPLDWFEGGPWDRYPTITITPDYSGPGGCKALQESYPDAGIRCGPSRGPIIRGHEPAQRGGRAGSIELRPRAGSIGPGK